MWQLNRNVQNNDSGLSTFKVSANLFYITLFYYITSQYILLSTNNRGFKRFFSLDEDMYSVHCKKVLLHKRNILTHFERFNNLVIGTAYLYQVIRCLSLHKNDTRNLRKLFYDSICICLKVQLINAYIYILSYMSKWRPL